MLANEATIEQVTGAPLGFAGPVDLKMKVKVVADHTVETVLNGIYRSEQERITIWPTSISDGISPRTSWRTSARSSAATAAATAARSLDSPAASRSATPSSWARSIRNP